MSLMLPRFFREKRPLDLLPVPDDENDVTKASKNEIIALDSFEGILDENRD